ncbi:WXG100 family type VII secretion target [Nakamurella lactea]|uniref:WXG100 family type VII secretion target n=1 Tax=Nakamurella lactea TaxID=459515 RepID=UPI00048F6CF0|nr:WXG100 family type VII secretion target [Nakamurella lactea]
MEGFSISSERITAAGGGVSGVADSLATEITAMTEMLDQIRAGWQSTQAAPRFAAAMQGHLDQATLIKNALVSHGASLTNTGRQFDQAESTLAAGIPAGA